MNINFIPGVHLHNCFKGKCVVMKSVSSSSDRESGEEELAKWLFCASNVLVAIKRRSNKVLRRLFMIIFCEIELFVCLFCLS